MENRKRNGRSLLCPNCLCDMFKHPALSVPFEENGATVTLVQVCRSCFYNPDNLNEQRMVSTLMAEVWQMPEPTAQKAARAIIEEAKKKVIPPEPLLAERTLSLVLAA